MARVGVTGHVDVPAETVEWIVRALTERLRAVVAPGWRGITCLAKGADQLFARAVLALDGSLQVVLPAQDYELSVIDDGNRAHFRQLLALADDVETMPYLISDRLAYVAASEEMLNRCDMLLAVWNGRPSRQMGDTADIVRKAREMQIPVTIIWPPGDPSDAGDQPALDRRIGAGVIPAGAPGRD
jgi:hypothetical protein